MIKRLQIEFVPVVGNCAELQWGKSPASKWFMAMAAQAGRPLAPGKTTQGLYTAGADGTNYTFMNNRDTERVLVVMDKALKKFQQNPPRKIEMTKEELEAPFTRTPLPSTSVIRVFSRIRPIPEEAMAHLSEEEKRLNASLGRDHLWILVDEVKAIIKAAGDSKDTFPLPPTLVARLVRFHLIDNVRGEPDMWRAEQVMKADFHAQVKERAEGRLTLTLRGEFAQRLADNGRGQEGTLEGECVIDVSKAKITRFRAYSEGAAWGHSTYTQGEPKGRFPLVIAMVEVDDATSAIVPPQAITEGGDYLRPRLRSLEKSDK